MDELVERLALAKLEWGELQNNIRNHDVLRAQIQGWAVTVGLAAAGLAVSSRVPAAALLGLFSTASFWIIDAQRRSVQRRLINRCITIESALAGDSLARSLAPASGLKTPYLAHGISSTSGSPWGNRGHIVKEALLPGTWALYGALAIALGITAMAVWVATR